ncbi:Signaling protein [Idiomarina baltica OS145]|uniref:Signaling protein n=2 Tax=Idiomarina baltica TaxID=190892 RepID=A0ABP2CS38_9GAMM|nr:Signaling protein [Idiomarina baltica OS145]
MKFARQSGFLLVIWALMLIGSHASASDIVTVSAQTDRLLLSQDMTFRVLPANTSLQQLDINRARYWQSFEALKQSAQANNDTTVWGLATLYNRSAINQAFVVDLGGSYVKYAQVFVINRNEEVIDSADVRFKDGLIQRPYLAQQMMLPIEVPARTTVRLLVSVETPPEYVNPIQLWNPGSLQLHLQQKQTALGINVGLMVLIAVAAFSMTRGNRRRLQLSIACVCVTLILVVLLHSGLWITYFSPLKPSIAQLLMPYSQQWLLVVLGWACVELFSRLARQSQIVRGLKLITLVFIVSAVLQPWAPMLRSAWWLAAQNSALMLTALLAMFFITSSRARNRVFWEASLLTVLTVLSLLITWPRMSSTWVGQNTIVVYCAMTATLLALLIANFERISEQLAHKVHRLKAANLTIRRRMRLFQQRSSEGWFELDRKMQWIRANKPFLSMLGCSNKSMLVQHWPSAEELFGEAALSWREPGRSEHWQQLVNITLISGQRRWFSVSIYPDGLGHVMDVSKQIDAEMQLNYLAKHDSLTGLLNFEEFKRIFQAKLDKQKPCTVMLIDIKGFDVLCDQVGGQHRDQALLQLILQMKKKTPQTMRLARYPVNGIAILGPDDEQAVFALCYQLVQIVREFRYSTEGRVFQFTANAGMAVAKDANLSIAERLIRQAHDAEKIAQQLGDFKVYSATADDHRRLQTSEERRWEDRLRSALVNQDWQVFRQPILSASLEQDKHCYEILLRLPNDDALEPDEAIAPQQFLNAAVQAGIMGKADRWLFRELIERFEEQPFEATRTWRCHVNLSQQSLEDADFINFIESMVAHSNIQPKQLMFEVAEPIANDRFEETYRLFKELNHLGFGTAIDQFGTGFNSFRLLKYLPLTQIKVNRFWVQNMLLDPTDAELVNSCIRLAQINKIEVTAVGVENDETRALLTKAQVDYLQGFACGKPTCW